MQTLASAIENKLNRSSKNISDKAETEKNEKKIRWIKWIGVFVFVAVPLPLTGVWTGTCVALFIGLSKKDTMLSVILGNLVAGIIMVIVSYFFADNTMIVLWVFLALVVLFAIVLTIRSIIRKIKEKKKNNSTDETIETSSAIDNKESAEENN